MSKVRFAVLRTRIIFMRIQIRLYMLMRILILPYFLHQVQILLDRDCVESPFLFFTIT